MSDEAAAAEERAAPPSLVDRLKHAVGLDGSDSNAEETSAAAAGEVDITKRFFAASQGTRATAARRGAMAGTLQSCGRTRCCTTGATGSQMR